MTGLPPATLEWLLAGVLGFLVWVLAQIADDLKTARTQNIYDLKELHSRITVTEVALSELKGAHDAIHSHE